MIVNYSIKAFEMIQGNLFEMNDNKGINNLKAPIVFNIGYQRHSLESFLKKMDNYKVDIVVDLRSTPYSKKPDFNREKLRSALSGHGIKYIWKGKVLGGFGVSRQTWIESLNDLALHTKVVPPERICLMCMESSVNQCHRKELMEILEREHGIQGFNL